MIGEAYRFLAPGQDNKNTVRQARLTSLCNLETIIPSSKCRFTHQATLPMMNNNTTNTNNINLTNNNTRAAKNPNNSNNFSSNC